MLSGLAALVLSLSSPILAGVIDTNLAPRALSIDDCPGYTASNIKHQGNTITANLKLAGKACNVYGTDIGPLSLLVEYETEERLHVKIYDAAEQVYQVPTSVLPRASENQAPFKVANQQLAITIVNKPFSFAVTRVSNGETLFNTSGSPIIFESQYLRLRTQLPENPNLYGLGEDTDPYRLNTTNYIRTLWSRDAYLVPTGENLYGNHPVYVDHRGANGTHGVFLLNSNGMDIKINYTEETGQYLEYNTIGGVFDFYFYAGSTPKEVSMQHAQTVGYPAMMPYWGFGFHQCRYGMQDIYEVAQVVANYSTAGIPLETMWTDIDYMDYRRVFTVDPIRFPINMMQQLVNHLHNHDQHYIVMVDPAVAYYNYPAFNNGVSAGAFLLNSSGLPYQGVVWPGVTAFPDWFADGTQGYWNQEFSNFFNPTTGVNIDGLWIDMNEASNFCSYPCTDPAAYAALAGDPPRPPVARLGSDVPIPGFPKDFQPRACVAHINFAVDAMTYYGENILLMGNTQTLADDQATGAPIMSPNTYPIWRLTVDVPANTTITYSYPRLEEGNTYIFETITRTVTSGGCGSYVDTNDTISTPEGTPPTRMVRSLPEVEAVAAPLEKRQSGSMMGLPGRDLVNPPYAIHDANGPISANTINTSIIHHNGLAEYDTHNLYGTMMSAASREAMINRRPGLRPIVITRSTFAGAGRQVGHWLGDNESTWADYLISIQGLLNFAGIFQIPMVGSDVCGYAGNTNENLCSRWAMLGAFSPFYRNHDASGTAHQEYYLWAQVTAAAKVAIGARYQLLDYIYSALYDQTQTGNPMVNSMFYAYPEDSNTFSLQYQYFLGDSLLVAPATVEDATYADIYLPNDQFYDFWTLEPVRGQGANYHIADVPFTSIPLFIKGGAIMPLRIAAANTTAELRKQDFKLIVAPGLDGTATGQLYLDEGTLIDQPATTLLTFTWSGSVFQTSGTMDYDPGVSISEIQFLNADGGAASAASSAAVKQGFAAPVFDAAVKTLTYKVNKSLTEAFTLTVG